MLVFKFYALHYPRESSSFFAPSRTRLHQISLACPFDESRNKNANIRHAFYELEDFHCSPHRYHSLEQNTSIFIEPGRPRKISSNGFKL